MNSENEIQMAMFRYSVICSLRHEDDERSLSLRIDELSNKLWTLPNGEVKQFSWGTIEKWFYLYRHGGLDALKPISRKDLGMFRGITEDICDFMDKLLALNSEIKTSVIFKSLRKEDNFKNQLPSKSTVYRYVRSVRPEKSANVKERRSFEAPYAGNLWQTDIMYGPYLPQKDARGKWRKKQTFLIAIIDDHSRLLCHGEFYFKQDILAYLHCLKAALQKRGIPEKLYCDNGQVFRSEDIKYIMAKLGSKVLHTRVRDCAAKGKIERFFRTVRDSFLNPFLITGYPDTLEELNLSFWKWGEQDYNLSRHSTICTTPMDRWIESSHKVKLMPLNTEDDIFFFTTSRKVKKDGTFSFKGIQFETSCTLAGKKVNISYDPFSNTRVYVTYEKQPFGPANILNRDFNNKTYRKKINPEKEQ